MKESKMYDFRKINRTKVTVDRLQNESTAKNYGCSLEKGQTSWMMVLGKVIKDEYSYYLEDVEGGMLSGGFPVGYAHDDERKYMIHLIAPGFYGAFVEG